MDREIFYAMTEVKVLTAQYRQIYNQFRSHSFHDYRRGLPNFSKTRELARMPLGRLGESCIALVE